MKTTWEGNDMKLQEAIKILMLSPCYWRMTTKDRNQLVREFCANFSTITELQVTKIPSKEL